MRLVDAALAVTLQLRLVDNLRKAASLQMNAASQQSSLAHLAPSFLTWLKHSLVVMSDKTATTKTCWPGVRRKAGPEGSGGVSLPGTGTVFLGTIYLQRVLAA